MKTNVKEKIYTREGARAVPVNAELMLRRSLMSCLLWENEFYEDGVTIAERIKELVQRVPIEKVADMAIEAREKMKLRHAPLWVVREMARHSNLKPGIVRSTLARVIQRADELAEFVALYWKDGKQPLSSQVKEGLADAFTKFDAYQLAKYDRDGSVKLRDVLFLCHAKPKDDKQAETWKKLVDGKLEPPDTWEVALSSGANKKETWERLITEKKLGAMALLRNLRNMIQEKVNEDLIASAIAGMSAERVLPFRFVAAARYTPRLEEEIEVAMMKSISGREKMIGKTVLLVDVSGSMDYKLSDKSDMNRIDAASGLAILACELCENVHVFTFSNHVVEIPSRRGFALRDAIADSQSHSATYLGDAIRKLNNYIDYDRIIVITDEQSHDQVGDPKGKGYLINVASDRNGIGYGAWTHIDGWSEAVFDYIAEYEKLEPIQQ